MTALDTQQIAAVSAEGERIMVLAGAGSGKTRVLIERIAYIIDEHKVSPYEIMAFTFTRKAAGEIKERLLERIGNDAHHVALGTMHALALGMINRFGDVIGMKSASVTVYSQWEEEFLLKEVAIDMGVHTGKAWKIALKEINAVFARYYQQGLEPEEEDPIRPLFLAFIQRCRENNSMTYGGLLVGLRLLIPTMAKYMHIKHILVDEVQDIDPLQWQIIRLMEKAFGAVLYVVGDIDQSIYEWRGAAPKYLVDHQDEFNIFRLETNYRSMPEIVTAANRLINHNTDRITKTMLPDRAGGRSRVIVEKNVDSHYITGFLKDTPVNEPIAILARNHGLLQKIDRLMSEETIPHDYIGKTLALTNSEEFRRFHAFLKLLVNPFDNFSFLLIRDLIPISREEYREIRVKAAQAGQSHFMTWEDRRTYLDGYHSNDLEKTVKDLSERLIDSLDIAPAVVFIQSEYHGENTIEAYLNWLATYDLQDEIKKDTAGITLMTIHAAKGLEWPIVIVAGCNEGILPSSQAIRSGDIEAERRLAYVAWTRARDQLLLTVRPEFTEGKPDSPRSRFIAESMG